MKDWRVDLGEVLQAVFTANDVHGHKVTERRLGGGLLLVPTIVGPDPKLKVRCLSWNDT